MQEISEIIKRIDEIKTRFGLKKNIKPSAEHADFDEMMKNEIHAKSGDMNSTGKADINREEINRIIDFYAGQNKVSSPLVKAMVEAESSYRPDAVSPKGAKGLMQLMPSVIKDMNVSDPFSPEENIRGGVSLMKQLLDHYNGDYGTALAAYNAGKGAVEKYGGIPDYRETKDYVRKVIDNYLRNQE